MNVPPARKLSRYKPLLTRAYDAEASEEPVDYYAGADGPVLYGLLTAADAAVLASRRSRHSGRWAFVARRRPSRRAG